MKSRKYLPELYSIIKYCRSAGSAGEHAMIKKHIKPLGMQTDKVGNLYKYIGKKPKVLWSCHTDTVHKDKSGPTQTITLDHNDNPTKIFKTDGEVLGADCGTGVWIMIQMIKAGVRGLYVFHRAEECGGIGSDYIVDKHKYLLDGIDKAIAFDRYGYESIVTHQSMARTCSDGFADSLARLLESNRMYFTADRGGSFTDTSNYAEVIPECTNISVGYMSHHTSKEYQDVNHAVQLCDSMLKLGNQFEDLPALRDPTVTDYSDRYTDSFNTAYHQHNNDLTQTIYDNPDIVATILKEQLHHLSEDEIATLIEDRYYINGENIPW